MEGRDRISELPADLIDKIMGKLWIGVAARMAVLNTVWRDAWYNLTELDFDDSFHHNIYADFDDDPATWHNTINDYLKKHNGNIKKFVVYFGLQVYIGEFDKLFLSVTKKDVQELDLQIYSDDGRNYRLPPCILKCPTLKTFRACGVKIDQITPRCMFPNVSFISFDSVHFDARSLQLHAVDLPKLQRLILRRCKNIYHFNITAPKLGFLSIEECYIGSDDECHRDNDDYYSDDDDDDDVDFNSDDDDHRYAGDNDDESDYDDDSNMFHYNPAKGKEKIGGDFLPANLDLGSVCRLHLCCNAIGGVVDDFGRKGLQMPALDVKYLNLSGVYYLGFDNNSKFVNLLRSCPKLCKLEICFKLHGLDSPTCSESVSNLLEGLHKLHHRHNDLQTLNFNLYSASKSEVQFITGLIGCFPTCKKVFIFCQIRFPSKEKAKVRKEILSSSRALSTAKVYLK
ncbi:unnamed protein product [Cuscuta epithymum]|uniref:F-box/LRR-repeat protein 15/At3g58940/PEG3-like LRR domain-containing protein n=1 Tax=Cuscuta epithymum TaxID=186058 RepID=A0AAV0FFN3_9ASTE|nr:unnamed protein product [Cuscuta epithymum]